MLNQKMIDALTKQVNYELQSGYIYWGMANYYADAGLVGFQHWFNLQAKEEYGHAMRIQKYLEENGVKVELGALEAVTTDYNDYDAPLKEALEHENKITEAINKLYELADDLKDYRTQKFLLWFIEEQQEEEDTFRTIIGEYELFGGCHGGLRGLNKKLGRRE